MLSGKGFQLSGRAPLDYKSDRTGIMAREGAMAGYTGHTPKSKEVIGCSYRGPPEGPAYHGTNKPTGEYHAPRSYNQWSITP